MINLFYAHLEKLPSHLTSYDILKTIALLLMVIDHIGYYFLPEDEILRALGRLCVPLWAFLIGYSLSDRLDPRLIAGTIIFALNAYICGDYFIPLTILFTFLVTRLIMADLARVAGQDYEKLIFILLGCVVFLIPTHMLMQYGTQIVLFALAGRFYRLRQNDDTPKYYPLIILMFANIVFAGYQILLFKFDTLSQIILLSGLVLTSLIIMNFKSLEFKTIKNPVINGFFMLCGRWTLELYLLNIISFAVLSNILGIGEREWFTLSIPNF